MSNLGKFLVDRKRRSMWRFTLDVLRRFTERESAAERLMVRLRKRLQVRRQGYAENYAERL
jgi:hypothetical protein